MAVAATAHARVLAPTSDWFQADEMPGETEVTRPGQVIKFRQFHDLDAGVAAGFFLVQLTDHYSPRHRHDDDQVRYHLKGSITYGPRETYRVGDVHYVPAGVSYGPLSPETPGPNAEPSALINIAFNSASADWWSRHYTDQADLVKARAELEKQGGRFERGVFRGADGTNKDAYEALVEHVSKRKIEYPAPRLQTYPVMHTPNFPWLPTGRTGVSIKELCQFFETGPRIRIVRLSAGTTLPAIAPQDHQQAWALLEGEIAGSTGLQAVAFRYVAPKTSAPEVRATKESVLFLLEWARLGERLSSTVVLP